MGLKDRAKKIIRDSLRPWLLCDVFPILHVSVSEITLILPGLEFDAGALNMAGMESSPLVIKGSMRVDNVQVTFTPFRQTVLSILVQGWHVDLEPRPADDVWWEKKKEKAKEQEKDAALLAIDPQGAAAHSAAEGLAEEKAGNSLITRFITSLMLTSLNMEFRDCSVRLVAHPSSGRQHICRIPLSSLEYGGDNDGEGLRRSGGVMGAVSTAFDGVWKRKRAPVAKTCLVKGFGLFVETQNMRENGHLGRSEDNQHERSLDTDGITGLLNSEGSVKNVDSHVVMLEEWVLGMRFTELALDAMEFEVPEFQVGLEVQEIHALQILTSQIQGVAQDSHSRADNGRRKSESGDAAPSKRNPGDLWKKAIQKVMERSSHGRLNYILQLGTRRSRYSGLYESWLLELGWGKRQDDGTGKTQSKKKRAERLKKLSGEISEVQKELPLEAIALGRRLARHRVSAARHLTENQIRNTNAMNQAARQRNSYASFQAFMVSFWRVIVTATFFMQGQAVAASWWMSAARKLGVSEWKTIKSTIWGSANDENVGAYEDSNSDSGLESSSVGVDNEASGDHDLISVPPENYFQLRYLGEETESAEFSSEKRRRWAMVYAFKIQRGSITLAGRPLQPQSKGREPYSRSKGGSRELEIPLIPAVRLSWNMMVLAYGSTGNASGTSMCCGNLDAELLSVISSKIVQRLSANLDAEVFHQEFSSIGRWTSKNGDRTSLISSSPCPRQKKNSSQTIMGPPFGRGIYEKFWAWQERQLDAWSKSWPSPQLLSDCSRPFLIAESNNLDDEPSPDIYPGGLSEVSLAVGQMDLILKGSSFTFICHLLNQLTTSKAPPQNENIDTRVSLQSQTQSQSTVSLQKVWDDNYSKYLDTCRNALVGIVPQKSILFSAVVECPKVKLCATATELDAYGNEGNLDINRRKLKLDSNTQVTVILDLGRLEMGMWPPQKNEEAVLEDSLQNVGDQSIDPKDLWHHVVRSKLWLKRPPVSLVPEDFAQRRDWEHEQVGSNLYTCIEGLALTLELKKGSSKELSIVGPLALVMETSLCWDQYSSLLRTSKSVSAAVSAKILSLSIQSYTAEVAILLQVIGFYMDVVKSMLGQDPVIGGRGGDLPLLQDEDSKDLDSRERESVPRKELPFTACALTVSLELVNTRLVLGDARQEDSYPSSGKGAYGGRRGRRLRSINDNDDGDYNADDWEQNPSGAGLGREIYVLIEDVSFGTSVGDEEKMCMLMGLNRCLVRLVNSGGVTSRNDLAKLRNDFLWASASDRRYSSPLSGYKYFSGLVLAEVALEYFSVKVFGAHNAVDGNAPKGDQRLEKIKDTASTSSIQEEDSDDVHEPATNPVDIPQGSSIDSPSPTVTLTLQSEEQFTTKEQGNTEQQLELNKASSSKLMEDDNYWFTADVEVSKVLVTDGSIDALVAKVMLVSNGAESLHLDFGLDRGFQKISMGVQGGLVLIHTPAVATLMKFYADLTGFVAQPARSTNTSSESPKKTSTFPSKIGSEDSRQGKPLPTVYRSASEPALSVENSLKRFKRSSSAPPRAKTPVAEKSEVGSLPSFEGVVVSNLAGFSLVLAKQSGGDSDGVLFELEMSTMLEVGETAKKSTFDLTRFTILGLQARDTGNTGRTIGRTSSRTPKFVSSFKLPSGASIPSLSRPQSMPSMEGAISPKKASETDVSDLVGSKDQFPKEVSGQSSPGSPTTSKGLSSSGSLTRSKGRSSSGSPPRSKGQSSPGSPSRSKEKQAVAGNGALSRPPSIGRQAEGFHKALSSFNSFILEQLSAHLAVEKVCVQGNNSKWTNAWQGQFSIAGCNVSITTSEIQLLQTLVAPLSSTGGSSKPTIEEAAADTLNEAAKECTTDDTFKIPNGAIIAIKDVYEHCYLAVEEVPSHKGQYRLAGVLHYTLAGDRALFKVKYQDGYPKHSNMPWFSLLSLHGKDASGEPLRVHYRPGSGLADISPTKKGSWEKWQFLPVDAIEDGNSAEVDIQKPTYRHLFHLLNQKGKSGLAFQHNVPVIVKQPGNPFKIKILAKSLDQSSESQEDLSKMEKPFVPLLGEKEVVDLVSSIPRIVCTFDTFIFTILHEAAGGLHVLPLLRLRIPGSEGIMQAGQSKTRTILQCGIVLEYFESRSSRWVSIINPIETDLFYRARSTGQDLAATNDVKCPVVCFARFRKVDVVFSEPSLDAVLFLIGALDLAGPFTMRYSPVQANRCLIENHTGVDALCSFDQGSSKIGGVISSWKSDSFLITHMTSRRDSGPAKVASTIELYLQSSGKGATSPVIVTLGDPGVFAIKTRLQTDGGQRTPGPIVVVDVSRRSEEGIIVSVSPMVRIRNGSGLPLELRCRRDANGEESAVVLLEDGDTIDDSMGAFDAINLSGELRKALSSLNLGKYRLSVRPAADFTIENTSDSEKSSKGADFDWSDDVKGAKPVQSSGLLSKFQYNLNNRVKARNVDSTFGTLFCAKKSSGPDGDPGLYFLIRKTSRQVPISRLKTEEEKEQTQGHYAAVAWQQQQELMLLPTVRVLNLTTSKISILLMPSSEGKKMRLDQEKDFKAIQSSGKESMYMDLGDLFLSVKHEDLDLISKPMFLGVGSKEFSKDSKGRTKNIEMEVDFGDGIHTALVNVRRGEDGVLEIVLLTRYTLQNDSKHHLLCCSAKQSSWWRGVIPSKNHEPDWPSSGTELTLAPKSRMSWFEDSTNVLFKRFDPLAAAALVDLESVSGSMEITLRVHRPDNIDDRIQLGVQLKVPSAGDSNPTCVILMVPRYVVTNESNETIIVSQDGFQDTDAMVSLAPGESASLNPQACPDEANKIAAGSEEVPTDDLLRVRFRPKESGWNWSGPVCAAAIGSFSVKLRRQEPEAFTEDMLTTQKPRTEDLLFAVLDVIENESSLVMTFRRQGADKIPYRIENALRSGTITYNQQGVDNSEVLKAGASVGYVWDDLGESHQLVLTLTNTALEHHINPDKLRSWKKFRQSRRKAAGLLQIPFLNDLRSMALYGDGNEDDDLSDPTSNLPPVGYEVYADGPTRVVRICEERDGRVERQWQSDVSTPKSEFELRIPLFTVSIVEPGKRPADAEEDPARSEIVTYVPVICLVLTNVLVEARITPDFTFLQVKAEDLGVDVKWSGAPVAAMLRGHGQDRFINGHTMLHMAIVMSNGAKNPIQLKYASFLLQAIDVNLDEDTLMKLSPFYRVSLSESTAPSMQIYFERFEIHPIKIVGSFLPGNPRADYSSGQETLRALLHSVVKVPTVRGNTVELNGVLLSNALLTFKQLALKCAQHYSWYTMRAIYIARGSKLLPPGFASLFDDSAASSLDVFFDPANGSIDLQGLTLGMFGVLKRGLRRKGKGGTQRYLGDFQHTVKRAGSNLLFAVVTEVSDSVLKGADASGFDGVLTGFRRGILNVAMKPSVLRGAVVQGGSSRRIKLDRIVGADEAYIEGYLQASLDSMYKQSYVRVKVVDDIVLLKNLPPNTTLMEEMVQCVRNFLIGEGLLAGESSAAALSSVRRLQGEDDRRLGPTVIALCEQLLVIVVVRSLRRQTVKVLRQNNITIIADDNLDKQIEASKAGPDDDQPKEQPRQGMFEGINLKRAVTGFALSSALAYADGRICRHIPNPLVRRIVSGFLLSFVE